MYIRWLGCFKKNGSLYESILFEYTRDTDVACEKLVKGKSHVSPKKARVGLLVDPSSVYKTFTGDVYSEYDVEGKLHPTRKGYEAYSQHIESFAHPVYTGLVIKDGSFDNLSGKARHQIISAVRQLDIPVYHLKANGKLEEIHL